MSRLHYKAEFIKKEKNELFYKYFPDVIFQKGVFGEFKFNVELWKPMITLKAKPIGDLVYYVDERCVESLTYKIKKHFEENKEFPQNIFYVA